MAENVAFCYPNWTLPSAVYTPTVTGAGWIDLAKLQGDVLSEMARYPGVTPADTKIVIDLGVERNIKVIALPFHNAKLGDTARARVATDAGFTSVVLDSGVKEFFSEVYPYGTLPWGHASWLDGHLTEEQAAGLTPPWMHISPETVLGRYVEIACDFSGNSDGFVDLGQVVVAQMLQPTYNMSYGVQPPFYRDPSTKSRSKGGTQFKDVSRKYRVCRMQLDYMSENELYGQFYEMVREYGVTKPFFFIYNAAADAALQPKQCFMATAERIGDPTNTDCDLHSLQIEISEEL